jgi:pimeloyl-ACP methyl ester carboxylesterase
LPSHDGYSGAIGKLSILAVSLATLLLTGCACQPLLRYSLDTPPLILVPASLANIDDGRGRFREIYCAVQNDHGASLPYNRPCEEVILGLEGEPGGTGNPVWLGQARLKLRVLVVSGIYSECINHITNAFSYALTHLERYGYHTDDLRVSGRSSSCYNANQIRNALLGMDLAPDEKVVLIGYSKGAPDILEAVVAYPEILQMVAAVVSVAGAVGGSPVADSIDPLYQGLLSTISVPDCPAGVGDPIESLKRSTRQQWLSHNRLPETVKYFSLSNFADRDDISALLQPIYDRLSLIDPRNDSQVIFYDQIIPGSTLLGYIKADHWAIAMPFSQDMPALSSWLLNKNAFPREVLLEAIIRFVEEKLLGPGK